jgi:type IV secretory pathway TrbD component
MRELKGDWKDLFNGFMVALDLRKCFLALCGIVVTIVFCGGLTITLGNHLDKDYVKVPRDLVLHRWLAAQFQSWHVIYKGAPEKPQDGAKAAEAPKPSETTSAGMAMHNRGRARAGFAATADVKRKPNPWLALGYSILFGLLFVTIWSYFGGAIARIAAYEIAKDGERIETRKALQFSRRKFWSFFWAPLICVIGFMFFALCNYAGGLVGHVLDKIAIGAPLVALLLPLALLSGFIMTLIAVGTVTGLPLFAPAVAAEGTDSFDAVSRGFSYVYSRPWHFLWYQLVSGAYGYVCIAFVILFAILMCHLGISAGGAGFELCGAWEPGSFKKISNYSWSVILSSEPEHQFPGPLRWDLWSVATSPRPYSRIQSVSNLIVGVDYTNAAVEGTGATIAGFLITLWLAITLGLSLGYVVSYFFSQQTMIYYILRKKVDGIEMNEVFEEQEEEAKPADAAKPMEGAGAAEPPKAEAKPAEPPKDEKK